MADITLSHITPQHFFETVRLLKMQEHRIYIGVDSIEVRFKQKRFESKEETDKRLEQLEHFMLFLQEIIIMKFKKDYKKPSTTSKNHQVKSSTELASTTKLRLYLDNDSLINVFTILVISHNVFADYVTIRSAV